MGTPIHIILSEISEVIPPVVGLYYYRKLGKDMRLLAIFFLILTSLEAAISYMAYRGVHNISLLNIFMLVHYSFLIFIFSLWQRNGVVRRSLRMSIFLFALVWLVTQLHAGGFDQFNNLSLSLGSIILVAVSGYILYSLDDNSATPFYNDRRFWVASGTLIYFAGNVGVFVLTRARIAGLFPGIWLVHSILNIVANFLYAGGFICRRQKSYGYSLP